MKSTEVVIEVFEKEAVDILMEFTGIDETNAKKFVACVVGAAQIRAVKAFADAARAETSATASQGKTSQ